MNIEKDHLFIAAEKLGSTIFTGTSSVNITGDYFTLQGFQFLHGDIGTKDVINTRRMSVLQTIFFPILMGLFFTESTETETWLSNICFGYLGIPFPASGIAAIDPHLVENVQVFLA